MRDFFIIYVIEVFIMSTGKPISTGMFSPLVDSDTLMCPHGGRVKLKSKKGKTLKSGDSSLILESDLLGAPITGCMFNIAGVPQPCMRVSMILPSALSLKKFNGDKAVIQQFSSMIFTDKLWPLVCIPKPNKWKVSASIPVDMGDGSNSKKGEFEPKDYVFNIRYSLNRSDTNSIIGLEYVKVINTVYSLKSNNEKVIEIRKYNKNNPYTVKYEDHTKSDEKIVPEVKKILEEDYPEKNGYVYKVLTLEISNTIFEYIFIGMKKSKTFGIFGYVEDPDVYVRSSNPDDYALSKPIVTRFIKTGMKLDKIDIVIS